jgi:hypothetical protein
MSGRYYFGYAKEYLSCASARYEAPSVTFEDVSHAVDNIRQNSILCIPEITLWNRLKQEAVQNSASKIKVYTNVVEVRGDMSQVIPMKFVEGNYVYPEDVRGCVLDTKTAEQLFGTRMAVNNTVLWKKKEYVVRGVIQSEDTMMLFQSTKEDQAYANVEAVYHEQSGSNKGGIVKDNEGQLLMDLLVQNGLKKPELIIDGAFNADLLFLLYRLPLWLSAFFLILKLIKIAGDYRKSVTLACTSFILFLVAAYVLSKITAFRIRIPIQFIPSKWSDFDFYVSKYNEIRNNTVTTNNMELMPKDIVRRTILFRSGFLTLLNSFTLITLYCIRDFCLKKAYYIYLHAC